MTWNHRIVELKATDHGLPVFVVAEVYYNDNGQPIMFTSDGCRVIGNTLEELAETTERIAKCLTQPVLKEATDFIVEEDKT